MNTESAETVTPIRRKYGYSHYSLLESQTGDHDIDHFITQAGEPDVESSFVPSLRPLQGVSRSMDSLFREYNVPNLIFEETEPWMQSNESDIDDFLRIASGDNLQNSISDDKENASDIDNLLSNAELHLSHSRVPQKSGFVAKRQLNMQKAQAKSFTRLQSYSGDGSWQNLKGSNKTNDSFTSKKRILATRSSVDVNQVNEITNETSFESIGSDVDSLVEFAATLDQRMNQTNWNKSAKRVEQVIESPPVDVDTLLVASESLPRSISSSSNDDDNSDTATIRAGSVSMLNNQSLAADADIDGMLHLGETSAQNRFAIHRDSSSILRHSFDSLSSRQNLSSVDLRPRSQSERQTNPKYARQNSNETVRFRDNQQFTSVNQDDIDSLLRLVEESAAKSLLRSHGASSRTLFHDADTLLSSDTLTQGTSVTDIDSLVAVAEIASSSIPPLRRLSSEPESARGLWTDKGPIVTQLTRAPSDIDSMLLIGVNAPEPIQASDSYATLYNYSGLQRASSYQFHDVTDLLPPSNQDVDSFLNGTQDMGNHLPQTFSTSNSAAVMRSKFMRSSSEAGPSFQRVQLSKSVKSAENSFSYKTTHNFLQNRSRSYASGSTSETASREQPRTNTIDIDALLELGDSQDTLADTGFQSWTLAAEKFTSAVFNSAV